MNQTSDILATGAAPSTPPPSSHHSNSAASSATSASASLGTPTELQYRGTVVYLGESKTWNWHAAQPIKELLNMVYVAFPADGREPFFAFTQALTPLVRGNMYEVSARHSKAPDAMRDPKMISIRVHSAGTPSFGQYIPIPKLPREIIVGEPADHHLYALVGVVADAPSKQSLSKDGRSFDLTTILIHVVDEGGELHLAKIKMWNNAPAEARKGVAVRAIGLSKSEFKGDTSFEATKLTVMSWGYKDHKDRDDSCEVADVKDAVAREERDDDVREVEVVLPPGAPRLSGGSPSRAAAAPAVAAKRGTPKPKAKKSRYADDEAEESEEEA